jgi:ATP adenylyltransferase
MKCLWSPWRMDYVLAKKGKGCLFCRILKEENDEENLIVYRGKAAFVMMNRFPYNNGHLMILPRRHHVDLAALNAGESEEIFFLLERSTRVLGESLQPHGFNVGINIGRAAGAGVSHLHLHIVPRWNGDTNFMPVVGEAKVIPETLLNTYHRLQQAFQAMSKKSRKGERRT